MREWKKAEQSNFGGKNPPGAWGSPGLGTAEECSLESL